MGRRQLLKEKLINPRQRKPLSLAGRARVLVQKGLAHTGSFRGLISICLRSRVLLSKAEGSKPLIRIRESLKDCKLDGRFRAIPTPADDTIKMSTGNLE